jgi:hypothetical protein
MMSDANNDTTDTDADPIVNEATDLLHADDDAVAEILPPPSPSTSCAATDTAAIIMETAALTSSSTLNNGATDGVSVDLPIDDVRAELPTPVEVKPTIATISAIVDEVRRKKQSGADIASIASQEVDRIFDAGTGQVEGGLGPSEQESYSLYNRRVKGGEWNGNNYADDGDTETRYNKHFSLNSNTVRRTAINQAFEGESIMDDFSELCEELGIKDMSHPQLLRTTRRRYKLLPGSLVRSTMCHYCMIITCLAGIALIVASAVTKGFDHVKKRNHFLHPAWVTEEETKKQEGKAWWVEENGESDDLIAPEGSRTIDNSKRLSPDELDQLYYSLSDAFLPMWFDQSTGWNGGSYAGAVKFCKSHYNFVPCPYEV